MSANPKSGARASGKRRLVEWGLALGTLCLLAWLAVDLNSTGAKPVVVYCAQDQVYAEPLFRQFERETGIHVKPVYDSEAIKTVGMANRLLSEIDHPQADLFWGNEELRTRQLAQRGVFRETNGWAGFGYRTRRIVINTNLLAAGNVPGTLLELTNAAWRRKVSLAYPMFGSTATHFHALRQLWGATNWLAWCHAFAANHPFLEDGNSGVVKRVGRGEALLGLTDSDDIAAGQREGLPVAAAPLTVEMLFLPNTVGVVRGAPHADSAQKLFDWLRQAQVTEFLVSHGALEGAVCPAGESVKSPDWAAVLHDLDQANSQQKLIFLQ